MDFIYKLTIFLYYFCDDAIFPGHLRSETITRNTNAVEFVHSHFKHSFCMSQCNFHISLNILLEVQLDVYIKIRSVGTSRTRNRTMGRRIYIINEIKKYDLNMLSLYYIIVINNFIRITTLKKMFQIDSIILYYTVIK